MHEFATFPRQKMIAMTYDEIREHNEMKLWKFKKLDINVITQESIEVLVIHYIICDIKNKGILLYWYTPIALKFEVCDFLRWWKHWKLFFHIQKVLKKKNLRVKPFLKIIC